MERIFAEEVFRAMQHIGWGEYTKPQTKPVDVVVKPLEKCSSPENAQSIVQPCLTQGVKLTHTKILLGQDLGSKQFSKDVYFPGRISNLSRRDMKN